LGRKQVVKSLALAKLWYVASVTSPPGPILNEVKKVVWEYIWNNKKQMVSRDQCYKPILEGGLGMTDIDTQCKCLKLKWLTKLMEGNGKENNDAIKLGLFFISNFDKSFKEIQVITTQLKNLRNDNVPKFYAELLETWKNLDMKRIKPKSKEIALEE
jgi:hypothetical protein